MADKETDPSRKIATSLLLAAEIRATAEKLSDLVARAEVMGLEVHIHMGSHIEIAEISIKKIL